MVIVYAKGCHSYDDIASMLDQSLVLCFYAFLCFVNLITAHHVFYSLLSLLGMVRIRFHPPHFLLRISVYVASYPRA